MWTEFQKAMAENWILVMYYLQLFLIPARRLNMVIQPQIRVLQEKPCCISRVRGVQLYPELDFVENR